MTTATIIAGTVGVIINSALVESISLIWRVMTGYIISASLLLFLTICDITLDVFRRDTAYWVTLVSVAVMSIGCTGSIDTLEYTREIVGFPSIRIPNVLDQGFSYLVYVAMRVHGL